MNLPATWLRALRARENLPAFKAGSETIRLLHTEDPYVRADRYADVVWFYWYHLEAPSDSDFTNIELFTREAGATRWVVRLMQNRGKDPQEKQLWQSEEFTSWQATENNTSYILKTNQGLSPGLFLDQRSNRQWVAQMAGKKSVLNLFSYTAGFGLVAARAGASSVLNIDTSKATLEWAKENALINSLTMGYSAMDVREFLKLARKRTQTYDLIICDPPSFARSKKGIWKIERDLPDLVRMITPALATGGQALLSSNFEGWSDKRFKKTVEGVLPDNVRFQAHHQLPPEFELEESSNLLKSCLIVRS